MFVKEYEKFKKNVEDTMWSFFKMTPDQIKQSLDELHKTYDMLYDLDVVSYKNVRPGLRNMLMVYKTMNYFYSIYEKLLELEDYICNVEVD